MNTIDKKWIVGFTDGEGCFHIGINQTQILPEFTIVQHVRNVQILYKIKKFFGCGTVRRNNGDR